MKKFILSLLLVCVACLSAVALGGCNKQIFDFNYSFTKAWICVGGEWELYEISKWTDYEDGEQIQITLKDGTVMLVHAVNCILINK